MGKEDKIKCLKAYLEKEEKERDFKVRITV
jgi:hypothetical protein